MSMTQDYLNELHVLLALVEEEELEHFATLLLQLKEQGGRLFLFGNGGSAATASHLVADLQKILMLDCQGALKAMALTDSVPLLTAWANDLNYAECFRGQLEAWLEPGDMVLALSGSGNSENVLLAVEYAKYRGAYTVGFCGFDGGELARAVHLPFVVRSQSMQRVEDMHMIMGHLTFCLLRERLQAGR